VKKIIKKLHLYLALALCIPLVLQGLSGSVIAFRSEISNAILSYKYDLAEGELASAEEAIDPLRNTTNHFNSDKFLTTTQKIS
jgi:uncharacterized iron-regulated membrane protein